MDAAKASKEAEAEEAEEVEAAGAEPPEAADEEEDAKSAAPPEAADEEEDIFAASQEGKGATACGKSTGAVPPTPSASSAVGLSLVQGGHGEQGQHQRRQQAVRPLSLQGGAALSGV